MGTFQVIKGLGALGPVLALLVLGFWITLHSGVAYIGDARALRRLGCNFAQMLLVLGTWLVGLAALQRLVGLRLDLRG